VIAAYLQLFQTAAVRIAMIGQRLDVSDYGGADSITTFNESDRNRCPCARANLNH
jgi:hypothetical protein